MKIFEIMKLLCVTDVSFDAASALVDKVNYLCNKEKNKGFEVNMLQDLDFYRNLAENLIEANKEIHKRTINEENERFNELNKACEELKAICDRVAENNKLKVHVINIDEKVRRTRMKMLVELFGEVGMEKEDLLSCDEEKFAEALERKYQESEESRRGIREYLAMRKKGKIQAAEAGKP